MSRSGPLWVRLDTSALAGRYAYKTYEVSFVCTNVIPKWIIRWLLFHILCLGQVNESLKCVDDKCDQTLFFLSEKSA